MMAFGLPHFCLLVGNHSIGLDFQDVGTSVFSWLSVFSLLRRYINYELLLALNKLKEAVFSFWFEGTIDVPAVSSHPSFKS